MNEQYNVTGQYMKTTEKQIAANRLNAAKSTGPVSPSGKAIAARNSLKHSLLAKEIVVDAGEGAESQEQFDALLLDLVDQFAPVGFLEEMLVEKIAVACWRSRRVHRYEVGLIRLKLDNVTQEYYKPETDLDPFEHPTPKRRDDEVDAHIHRVQKKCQSWQDDRDRFTTLRQDSKDLQEIYDRPDNWDWLYTKLEKAKVCVSGDTPAEIHESLRAAGWTDDAIWQGHLEICTEQIAVQTRAIQDLQKEKQGHAHALQVRRKLGCIPDGHSLDRLLKYEGAIEKQLYRALSELERVQRIRAGDNVPAPMNIDLAVHAENTG
jgi:hypothetical protein